VSVALLTSAPIRHISQYSYHHDHSLGKVQGQKPLQPYHLQIDPILIMLWHVYIRRRRYQWRDGI